MHGLRQNVDVQMRTSRCKIQMKANVYDRSGDGNHHFRPWKTTADILKHFTKIR